MNKLIKYMIIIVGGQMVSMASVLDYNAVYDCVEEGIHAGTTIELKLGFFGGLEEKHMKLNEYLVDHYNGKEASADEVKEYATKVTIMARICQVRGFFELFMAVLQENQGDFQLVTSSDVPHFEWLMGVIAKAGGDRFTVQQVREYVTHDGKFGPTQAGMKYVLRVASECYQIKCAWNDSV
ncbi:MAG: hypothetical protein LBJ92_01990 [Holosporales bacterium]|jgi:hypothetical protein|nr:hypothetical protein [Holosporales bacterium]